MMAVNCEAIVG